MAQETQLPLSVVARRPWLWPVVSIVVLAAIAVAVSVVARQYYNGTAPNTFNSVFASNLLQGTVIVIGAAVIAALLGVLQEMRAKGGQDMAKRLELFRRMRAAHVRIACAQGLLRADDNPESYAEQMRALMAVSQDLGEIRMEVKVSDQLYGHDLCSIMEGIARIIKFLEQGIIEYVEWCKTARELRGKPSDNPWMADLIKPRKSKESELDPSNENWEPTGNLPEAYENALSKSKGIMRLYAYGTRIRAGVRAR